MKTTIVEDTGWDKTGPIEQSIRRQENPTIENIYVKIYIFNQPHI